MKTEFGIQKPEFETRTSSLSVSQRIVADRPHISGARTAMSARALREAWNSRTRLSALLGLRQIEIPCWPKLSGIFHGKREEPAGCWSAAVSKTSRSTSKRSIPAGPAATGAAHTVALREICGLSGIYPRAPVSQYFTVWLLCLAISIFLPPCLGQHSIEQQAIAGGAGEGTSADHTIAGTIGQAVVTAVSDETRILESGFWPGALELVAEGDGGPTLFIQLQGAQLTITWDSANSDFVLEETDMLGQAWTIVPSGSDSAITIPAAETARFYRLRKP